MRASKNNPHGPDYAGGETVEGFTWFPLDNTITVLDVPANLPTTGRLISVVRITGYLDTKHPYKLG